MPSFAQAQSDPKCQRDLRVLIRFVSVYCDDLHADQSRTPAKIATHDVAALAGRQVTLCPDCTRLLTHALVKRSVCPMNPKPMCKHCPNHCYHPTYRAQIKEVMRHSGKKIMLHGRLDYLLHLLF
ncbi:MAG: nitrous oxide-stimulated promoter family protein [Phycisphaeraceae bacterium]